MVKVLMMSRVLVRLDGAPGSVSATAGKDGLLITGLALIEGTWNKVFYSNAELERVADQLKGKALTVDHSKSVLSVVGKFLDSKWDNGIRFLAQVENDKIAKSVRDYGVGISMELYMDQKHNKKMKRLEASNLEVVRASLVLDPACPTNHCPVVVVENSSDTPIVMMSEDTIVSACDIVFEALATECEQKFMTGGDKDKQDARFRKGFEGCVEAIMACRGLSREEAVAMCNFIFHRRGGAKPASAS